MSKITRRSFATGMASMAGLFTASCTSTSPGSFLSSFKPAPPKYNYKEIYGPILDGEYEIPGIDLKKLDRRFYRQLILDPTGEPPGSIVVDTSTFQLFHVEPEGQAWRYGVGLGKAGFEWAGRARVGWKKAWPTWTPPEEMIERRPELEKYSEKNGGMPPGLDNPLGARAIYIFQGNVDTLYRIHGTPEYWTIGTAASSGCVRMINQDVIHLFDRVQKNSPILVKGSESFIPT